MRSTPCHGWSGRERQQHCKELSLKGAAVMTCPRCVASSGAQTLPLRYCFQIRPASATDARGWGGSQAPGHSCHTGAPGSYWASDRSGVGHRGESNCPLAPWHPPPRRPVIPCSRGMIICMTEPGAFAASDYDSPWQQAFFSSLSHAPVKFDDRVSCTAAGKGVWLDFINNIT